MLKCMAKCISCGHSLDTQLCFIGEQYPSAIYNKSSENNANIKSSSLDLAICSNIECRLVQLNEIVNLDYVYLNYPYQTSTTATMKTLLKEFTQYALMKSNVVPGDVILDIGGNDGTLLSNFTNLGVHLVNIDVASGVEQLISDDLYTYINAKFSMRAYERANLKAPKLIFSSAVFYQIPDPNNFCADLCKIMDDDSIFFLQMTYLGTMFRNRVFDNIVHEHLGYYSLLSLSNLLERHSLKIIDASIIEIYGGSLRVMIVKETSKLKRNTENINSVEFFEVENKINEIETMLAFELEFSEWKNNLMRLLNDLIIRHGFVVGLGASTKGNMLLQALKLNDSVVKYIIDNNEKKIGTWTSGSLIPIVGEEYLEKPHKAIFLLPYYYFDFFTDILKRKMPKESCIELLVPLPYPKIVKIWGAL